MRARFVGTEVRVVIMILFPEVWRDEDGEGGPVNCHVHVCCRGAPAVAEADGDGLDMDCKDRVG
jgi:hypothetical protein